MYKVSAIRMDERGEKGNDVEVRGGQGASRKGFRVSKNGR